MKCREAKNFIQMELDGLLTPALAAKLQEHCQACTACQAAYKEAWALHTLLEENFSLQEAPADFADSIMAALPQAEKPKAVSLISNAWHRYIFAFAAILLILAASSSLDMWEKTPLQEPGLPVAEEPGKLPPSIPTDTLDPLPEPGTDPITNPDQETEPDTQNPDTETPPPATAENPPPQNTEEEPNQPQPPVNQPGEEGELYLPQVAYGSRLDGDFSLTLLADHQGAAALHPKVLAGDVVEYTVSGRNGYEIWQQNLAADSPPEMISESDSAPAGSSAGNKGEVDWVEDLSSPVNISPDSSMVAANFKGEKGGLWFSDNHSSATPVVLTKKAGGGLLAWSPNSGKIAFNDAAGRLYVAYPLEELVLMVFDGQVKNAAWSADSKTLVFCAVKGEDSYSKLFSIALP